MSFGPPDGADAERGPLDVEPADEQWPAAPVSSSAGRRRGRLVGVVGGSVLLAGATFFGMRTLRTGGASPAPARAATAGAQQRNGVSGTLVALNGSTLTVSAAGGRITTVETSASTLVTATVPGTLADIEVGDRVVATGTGAGTAVLAAQSVSDTGTIDDTRGGHAGSPDGDQPGGAGAGGEPNAPHDGADSADAENEAEPGGFAAGTVKDVSGTTITITQNDGTTMTLTTTPATTFSLVEPTSVQQLKIGQPVVATGTINGDGTVAATEVRQGAGRGGHAGGGEDNG